MAHWNRILVVAGMVGGALAAQAAPPVDRAAIEDALLLRLGDSLASSASAEANALAVAARLRGELRGCGTVQVDGAVVSLSAPGCRMADGMRLGAPLSLAIHRSARGLTMVLTDGVNGAAAHGAVEQVSAGAVVRR
jgi:hypothetical protein